jgi:transposase InsO family protein
VKTFRFEHWRWEGGFVRLLVWAIAGFFRSRASLVSDNLCLRQQLLVLQRKHTLPRLRDRDRRFWILDSLWLPRWRVALIDVTSETVLFRTIYVFFIIHHASREVVHVRTTRHPTNEWTGRQIVEACGWDREPPRFLIHDRDRRHGTTIHLRLMALGVRSVRTPLRSPRANAIAERWVKSVRTECLDHLLILNEWHLQRVLTEYVARFNRWRPHRALEQRASCG